jgi:hypothetical protein
MLEMGCTAASLCVKAKLKLDSAEAQQRSVTRTLHQLDIVTYPCALNDIKADAKYLTNELVRAVLQLEAQRGDVWCLWSCPWTRRAVNDILDALI